MGKRGRLSQLWHDIKKEKWAYIFLAAPMGLMGVFRIYPVLGSLALSFLRLTAGEFTWVAFDNYKVIIGDPLFWQTVKNTLMFCGVVAPTIVGISVVLAFFIFDLSPRVQSFYTAAFYLPGVCALVALSVVWLYIFNPAYGALNYSLKLVNLKPIQWLGNPKIALWSLMSMYVFTMLGFPVLVYLAALGSIPFTLYEAAQLDGASRWLMFWRITLPLLKPTTLFLLVIESVWSLQVFDQIYVLTGGGPYYATSTVVYYVYETAFHYLDFGIGAAQAAILFFIIVVLSIIQFKLLSTQLEY